MLKRSIAALVLAVGGFSCPVLGDEASLPKSTQKWIEVRTQNFCFFSNAGGLTTRQVAVDLEELRAVLAKLTDYDLQSPIPTNIYVFKGDRSFLPYKTLYNGRPAAVTGYFIAGNHANYIAINADATDASATVFHEYVHYVANNNMWNLPAWFSEGLAQFYESFEVVGDTVYIGLPILRHLITLRGAVPIPLEELFAVDHNSELYNEADGKGMFYSQSWAVVHYLLLGNEDRRRQLGTYLELVRNGAPANDAFTTAFAGSYESLTQEIRVYLRTLRFPSIETRAEIDLDKNLQTRKMPYAEVLYRLGDLLANHGSARLERRTYFETAIAVDPEYGAPVSAMAVEAENRADWAAAQSLHERAAKISPEDPMVLFRWGEFLSRRGGYPQRAVEVLTRSTKIDPSFAPAWAVLASVYADTGETSDEAFEAARNAHEMRPSDTMATRDLVRLYLRADRRREALSLIESSLRSNRRMQAEARTLVVQHDLERAQFLLREDRAMEAMARLDLASTLVDRSLYPEVIQTNIDWTRRSINEHRAAVLYNHAQELFSQDDRQGARKALNDALEIVGDGPVAASSRQLLDLIDHPDRVTSPKTAVFNPSPTRAEIDELNQLIAEKDFEGALEFLEGMRGNLGVDQRNWLDDRIAEIQRTLDYNRYVDEYNRAVEFYNLRQYIDAIRVLEKLLETLPEGREADSARALISDAREALD